MAAFKLCKGCPTPAKCKAAGKCLKKKMAMGGMSKANYAAGGTTTDMMPPNYGQQKPIGGSMVPGMMNRGGMGKKKKTAPKGPAIMIAIAMPAKKGTKRATGTRKK